MSIQAAEPAATAAADRPLFLVVLQPPAPGQARFDVTNHGGTVEFDGGHRLATRIEVTLADNIGLNLAGQATVRLHVIITHSGEVITAFPY